MPRRTLKTGRRAPPAHAVDSCTYVRSTDVPCRRRQELPACRRRRRRRRRSKHAGSRRAEGARACSAEALLAPSSLVVRGRQGRKQRGACANAPRDRVALDSSHQAETEMPVTAGCRSKQDEEEGEEAERGQLSRNAGLQHAPSGLQVQHTTSSSWVSSSTTRP